MSNMKGVTAIACGFMNGDLSLSSVIKLTVEFIGRKITTNEFKNISRSYAKKQSNGHYEN